MVFLWFSYGYGQVSNPLKQQPAAAQASSAVFSFAPQAPMSAPMSAPISAPPVWKDLALVVDLPLVKVIYLVNNG